jgi:hypothetical protein
MNDALAIDGVLYCQNCLNEKFPDEASVKGRQVTKELDPTICVRCECDNGEMPHQKVGEYPMCRACMEKHASTILPAWVKAFFAGILVLVIVSFFWNMRFIKAYSLSRKMDQAMNDGDIQVMTEMTTQLAANVPEIRDFRKLAAYYKGITLLHQDKNEEALELFKMCTDFGPESNIDLLITQAEIGVAADTKDFRRFVVASQKLLLYDTSATSYAQLASAYSCLYASERNDSIANLSREYLMKARLKNDTTVAFRYYATMIEYRLATGDPVSREEYEKLFPINSLVN